MDPNYRAGLLKRIDQVFDSHPDLPDHRRRFPWLTGALGDPTSGIWFVGENPSLRQVERVSDPQGGRPTEEAQWWGSTGDRLSRDQLVANGFKQSPAHSHGGWRCYITNAIKEADYAVRWRGSPAQRQREAARAWASVLCWELDQSRPRLIVALGKTVRSVLSQPVQHYSYVALRPRREQGPMHPDRVREYADEFASIAKLHRSMGPGN